MPDRRKALSIVEEKVMFSLLAVVATVLLVGLTALWRGVARLRRRLVRRVGADAGRR